MKLTKKKQKKREVVMSACIRKEKYKLNSKTRVNNSFTLAETHDG